MKLTYFIENEPFGVTEFPFDDMYVESAKFLKLAQKEDQWLGIIKGDYQSIIGAEFNLPEVDSLEGFINFQTGNQITKAEIINSAYKQDQQIKILRDMQAGRNIDQFEEFDNFVQSIP